MEKICEELNLRGSSTPFYDSEALDGECVKISMVRKGKGVRVMIKKAKEMRGIYCATYSKLSSFHF